MQLQAKKFDYNSTRSIESFLKLSVKFLAGGLEPEVHSMLFVQTKIFNIRLIHEL